MLTAEERQAQRLLKSLGLSPSTHGSEIALYTTSLAHLESNYAPQVNRRTQFCLRHLPFLTGLEFLTRIFKIQMINLTPRLLLLLRCLDARRRQKPERIGLPLISCICGGILYFPLCLFLFIFGKIPWNR